MKSIKPGRGPSFMSGISALFAGLFGVFWTIMACAMGAWFMAPFGLIFIGIAVANAIYAFKNATSENRYSSFDIVDGEEESDPLNKKYGKVVTNVKESTEKKAEVAESRYCPWCGTKVEGDYLFCNSCGKKLP